MPVTVNINGLSVVHQGSGGIATATVPDVCNTPSATGPVPIPYPNVALSTDLVEGTTSVQIDGASAAIQGSKFAKSTGDEAGVAGGVTSGTFAMEASFISFSPTVMLDGKPACRLTDKMLMNKGNTVCMGGVMQSPLPPDPPASMPPDTMTVEPEAPKHCALRGLTVECGHGERNLQLDLSKRDVQVLQVIGGASKPDKLVVTWDGTCGYGHSYCPSVAIREDEDWKVLDRVAQPIALPAPSGKQVDWAWIFTMLTGQTDFECDYRTLSARRCLGHAQADVGTGQWLQIQTFPEVEWEAKLAIGYSHDSAEKAVEAPNTFGYDEKSTWTITPSGKVKYGDDTTELTLETGQRIGDMLPVFGPLLEKIGRLTTAVHTMAKVAGGKAELTPLWPNWSWKGGAKLVEVPGKPTVGWEGFFEFGFDPLFGVGLKVSILDWVIRFASTAAIPAGGPALALALTEVREKFAEGAEGKWGALGEYQASLDIDIELTLTGDIKGGFGVKFADGESEINPDAARIEAGVEFKVEGRIVGKARLDGHQWTVEAAAAVKVGSMGAKESNPEQASRISGAVVPKGGRQNPLAAKGEIEFNGLAVYYLCYIEAGAGGADSDDKKKKGGDERSSKARTSGSGKVEHKGVCTLLEPWTWPKERA